jgi:hypothetical protein
MSIIISLLPCGPRVCSHAHTSEDITHDQVTCDHSFRCNVAFWSAPFTPGSG